MRPMDAKPDDRAFFVACCEAMTGRKPRGTVPAPLFYGYVDHFAVADATGRARRWAETRAEKFAHWGWWEQRNNYDAWLLLAGIDAYEALTGRQWRGD